MKPYNFLSLLCRLKENVEEYDELLVRAIQEKVGITARRHDHKGSSSEKISCTVQRERFWWAGWLAASKECCPEISGPDGGVAFLGCVQWSSNLAVTISATWEFLPLQTIMVLRNNHYQKFTREFFFNSQRVLKNLSKSHHLGISIFNSRRKSLKRLSMDVYS